MGEVSQPTHTPKIVGMTGARAAIAERSGTLLPEASHRTIAGDLDSEGLARTPPLATPRPRGKRGRLLTMALLGVALVIGSGVAWTLWPPSKAVTTDVTPGGGPGDVTPRPYVPDGFKEAMEDKIEDMEKRKFFKAIVPERSGLESVKFVLIPRTQESDPPSFYMMETKVSNRVFSAWIKGPGGAAFLEPPNYWSEKPPRMPALGMTLKRAQGMLRSGSVGCCQTSRQCGTKPPVSSTGTASAGMDPQKNGGRDVAIGRAAWRELGSGREGRCTWR